MSRAQMSESTYALNVESSFSDASIAELPSKAATTNIGVVFISICFGAIHSTEKLFSNLSSCPRQPRISRSPHPGLCRGCQPRTDDHKRTPDLRPYGALTT